MRTAQLELLDAVNAQAGLIGQSFLREPCRESMLSEQVRERGV